jgi:hypothetical protein
VGGYAAALGKALSETGDRVAILVPGEQTQGADSVPPMRTATGLAKTLVATGAEVVILHYSGYGYANRGAPGWLARGIEDWRRGSDRRRLVTVFHEVFATGPPWRSSFWLSPLQRRIAASLAGLSDALWTTLQSYASLLGPWASGRAIVVYPVFSTIGEPKAVPSYGSRSQQLVIFGGIGVRQRAYENMDSLVRACRALAIDQIFDVGPPMEVPQSAGGIAIRKLGLIDADEVASLLVTSRAGFLGYEPRFLAKSTIFAAYCAHGILPVCAALGSANSDLAAGSVYWDPSSSDAGEAAKIAARAAEWYSGHRLAVQARRLQSLLTV